MLVYSPSAGVTSSSTQNLKTNRNIVRGWAGVDFEKAHRRLSRTMLRISFWFMIQVAVFWNGRTLRSAPSPNL